VAGKSPGENSLPLFAPWQLTANPWLPCFLRVNLTLTSSCGIRFPLPSNVFIRDRSQCRISASHLVMQSCHKYITVVPTLELIRICLSLAPPRPVENFPTGRVDSGHNLISKSEQMPGKVYNSAEESKALLDSFPPNPVLRTNPCSPHPPPGLQ
jgi:hypothetical protein